MFGAHNVNFSLATNYDGIVVKEGWYVKVFLCEAFVFPAEDWQHFENKPVKRRQLTAAHTLPVLAAIVPDQ